MSVLEILFLVLVAVAVMMLSVVGISAAVTMARTLWRDK